MGTLAPVGAPAGAVHWMQREGPDSTDAEQQPRAAHRAIRIRAKRVGSFPRHMCAVAGGRPVGTDHPWSGPGSGSR